MKGASLQGAAALSADQLQRHERAQRLLVVTLGCLWLLAFATGCSRNSKNCSAYDGVDFGHNGQVEQVVPQGH